MKSHKCKYNNILLLYLYTTNKKNKLISTNNSFLCGKQCCITVFCAYLHMHIIKWRDIRPSMVTHTRNMCSAIIPSKVHTHSSGHTHTPWTHTRSSGQPFMLRHPGSSWGFYSRAPQSWYWRWRERCTLFTPPTYNSWRTETRICNLWFTGHELTQFKRTQTASHDTCKSKSAEAS